MSVACWRAGNVASAGLRLHGHRPFALGDDFGFVPHVVAPRHTGSVSNRAFFPAADGLGTVLAMQSADPKSAVKIIPVAAMKTGQFSPKTRAFERGCRNGEHF